VHQATRYSRLPHHHFEEFCALLNDADVVWGTPRSMPRTRPIRRGRARLWLQGDPSRHRDARGGPKAEEIWARLCAREAGPGDMVVCLGRAPLHMGNALPDALAALKKEAGCKMETGPLYMRGRV